MVKHYSELRRIQVKGYCFEQYMIEQRQIKIAKLTSVKLRGDRYILEYLSSYTSGPSARNGCIKTLLRSTPLAWSRLGWLRWYLK